jgi:hypothetical protein
MKQESIFAYFPAKRKRYDLAPQKTLELTPKNKPCRKVDLPPIIPAKVPNGIICGAPITSLNENNSEPDNISKSAVYDSEERKVSNLTLPYPQSETISLDAQKCFGYKASANSSSPLPPLSPLSPSLSIHKTTSQKEEQLETNVSSKALSTKKASTISSAYKSKNTVLLKKQNNEEIQFPEKTSRKSLSAYEETFLKDITPKTGTATKLFCSSSRETSAVIARLKHDKVYSVGPAYEIARVPTSTFEKFKNRVVAKRLASKPTSTGDSAKEDLERIFTLPKAFEDLLRRFTALDHALRIEQKKKS